MTETGIEVLRAANKLSDDTDMSEVERQSYNYYQKALAYKTLDMHIKDSKNREITAISLEELFNEKYTKMRGLFHNRTAGSCFGKSRISI